MLFFTFHDQLNSFLPSARRNQTFSISSDGISTLKHLIESLGIPHTEVFRILLNGSDTSKADIPKDGDRVDVFPPRPGEDPWIGEPRFVLDNHLGSLATYLRILGFDTLYRNDFQDEELAQISAESGRILLTRDRRLLMRKQVAHGLCITSQDTQTQVRQVLSRYDLFKQAVPFQRCLRCNGLLRPVSKESILDRLQPLTRLYYDEFHICPDCGQVYWKGSHYDHMQTWVEKEISSK